MKGTNEGFSQRVWRWLQNLGFEDDPFGVCEAEREDEVLPYLFIDRPYLYDILGNPEYPRTTILLANRGMGKTATCEMIAHQCEHGMLRRRALPVRYYDFNWTLEQVQGDVSKVTARHHIQGIVRATLRVLADYTPPAYFDQLQGLDRALLMAFVAEFADGISHMKLAKIIREEPAILDWHKLSLLEILRTLANIVTQLGRSSESAYQSLYILVDRVDETAGGLDEAISLLKPLIAEKPLLNVPGVAFKLFLALQTGEELGQMIDLRPDRFPVRRITWDAQSLQNMVSQRLTHYSNGHIGQLEDLCNATARARITDRLIKETGGSPRTMLRLCRALIHHHVEYTTRETLIDTTSITQTIHEFRHQLELETQTRDTLPTITITPPPPIADDEPMPTTGLYLDANGHVWVDGQQVPPLSQQEITLLESLYRQSPEIVPHEVLIEVIWPSSEWATDQAYNEQNLRKLVSRLREALDAKHKSRFVKSVRGRGYWLQRR